MKNRESIGARGFRFALPGLLCLWVLLVGFQLGKDYHTPIMRDDATYGQVAKNLVLGQSYSITNFDKILPFAFGISSGPAVILPAAFIIKLFGNGYWAPGFANILLINLLLLIAYRQLKKLIRADGPRRLCAALFLLFALLITNNSTGFPDERMQEWHALMGEIPSALFIILAALHMAQNRYDPRTVFTAGLLAGMGALCKQQSLFGAGMLGIYLVLSTLLTMRNHNLTLRRAALGMLLYGVGITLPLAIFEAVKIQGLGGWQAYLIYHEKLRQITHILFATSSSQGTIQKLGILGEYLGWIDIHKQISPLFFLHLNAVIVALLALLFFCLWRIWQGLTNNAPVRWACDALLLCSMGHLLWWIFICSWTMPRYSTQGLLYGCAALAIGLSLSTPRKALLAAIIVLGLRYDAVAYLATATQYGPGFSEQQAVVQKLEAIKHDDPDTVFFSCGYTYELDYLLPTPTNFIECERMQEPGFAKNNKVLMSFTVEDTGKVLYYPKDGFESVLRDNLETARTLCPADDLFKGNNYFIASCRKP